MHRSARLIALAFLWQIISIVAAHAAPDPSVEATFKKLMTATVSADYEGFAAGCDATMKAAVTKPKLEELSKQIAPRLTRGYDAEYLGELNQRGFAEYLWRVRCQDGGDDFLATLSLKDGKVGGFYLH